MLSHCGRNTSIDVFICVSLTVEVWLARFLAEAKVGIAANRRARTVPDRTRRPQVRRPPAAGATAAPLRVSRTFRRDQIVPTRALAQYTCSARFAHRHTARVRFGERRDQDCLPNAKDFWGH